MIVIDEVHSYDAYMSVFLHELLRWCGRMGAPVILMSATLSQEVRSGLINAWRQGAGLSTEPLSSPSHYPHVHALSLEGAESTTGCAPFRPDLAAEVRVLGTPEPNNVEPIAEAVVDSVSDGGVALVIQNSVRRAQEIWRLLRAKGVPAMLLHGRLTAAARAERTDAAVSLLGANGARPAKMVVVATQIAEQSFDVDADILFTDIAPMDLLLQRCGRLHRHTRPDEERPLPLRTPRVVVTGLAFDDEELPVFADDFSQGDRPVYRRLPLLAAAAELRTQTTWQLPSDVPQLVNRAYQRPWLAPESWAAEAAAAEEDERRTRLERGQVAETWRLDRDPERESTTLENLHFGASNAAEGGDRAVVRDTDDSFEVSLITYDGSEYRTLSGRRLGSDASRAADVDLAREVLGDSVRLRWREEFAGVTPLPVWATLPLLSQEKILVLDASRSVTVGSRTLIYDMEEGLIER